MPHPQPTGPARAGAPPHRSIRAGWLASVVAVTAACGDGPTAGEARARPGVRLVSGATAGDTIGATPAPLVAEVRDAEGRPLAGVGVRFVTNRLPRPDGEPLDLPPLPAVWFVGSTVGWLDSVVVTTDARGRAVAPIRLGWLTGAAQVVVRAAGAPGADTARIAVRPGAPVRVQVLPADTAVYLGRDVRLRGARLDRAGNPVPGGALTYGALDASVDVTDDGRVTGRRAAARTAVVVRSGTWTDTTHLTVLPVVGTIAVALPPRMVGERFRIAVVDLDGSGWRPLAPALGMVVTSGYADTFFPEPRWSADGQALWVRTAAVFDPPRIWRVPLDGSAPQRLLADGPAGGEGWLAPAPDGRWVYYQAIPGAYGPFRLRRVRPDGTGDEPIPDARATDGAGVAWETRPAISPDGEWLAWVPDGFAPRLALRRIASGERTPLDVAGSWPAWAPDGARLAYVGANPGHEGPLRTVRPDGRDDRLVVDGPYAGPLGWSPDGQWLLARRIGASAGPEIIEVATGARYPLPRLANGVVGGWRPAPLARP